MLAVLNAQVRNTGSTRLTLAVLAATIALLPAGAQADGPPVRAVVQKPRHCGVACAETILRAYRNRRPWTRQTALAATLCARMPEFKWRRPAADEAIETYYPDFQETYQPELAELLIDRGYCVISTRSSIDRETKKVTLHVWELLQDHLAQNHMAIIHVPGHYLVVTGIDPEQRIVYFVDPWRAKEVFSTNFSAFAGGQSFHTTRFGKPRPGWDGRMLIFWKGAPRNHPDHCPVCRAATTGKTYAYCRKCRCYIDRRPHNRVQRAIDVLVTCRRDETLTNLSRARVRTAFRRLEQEDRFRTTDLRAALLHYPLSTSVERRFATLHRYAEAHAIDLSPLSVADLIAVVTSQDDWREAVQTRLASRKPTP